MKPLPPPLLAEPPDPLPEMAHQAMRDATVCLWRDLWEKAEQAEAWRLRAEFAEHRAKKLAQRVGVLTKKANRLERRLQGIPF